MSRGFHVMGASGSYFSKEPNTTLLKYMLGTQIAELKSEIKSGPWFWEKKDQEFIAFKQNKIDGLVAINGLVIQFENKHITGKQVFDSLAGIKEKYPDLCDGVTSTCANIVSSVWGHFLSYDTGQNPVAKVAYAAKL